MIATFFKLNLATAYPMVPTNELINADSKKLSFSSTLLIPLYSMIKDKIKRTQKQIGGVILLAALTGSCE